METIAFLIFAISFVSVFSLITIIKQWLDIKDLKLQKRIAENDAEMAKNMYRNQISLLQAQVRELSEMRSVHSENLPLYTIQAVRYAMKHAHPDNGGNAEDFMKFQKCYEELLNKRRD